MFDFDLFVIGGGSGGVRCARVAASHGARVGIAEQRFWGGTCVNVGCVPKKILVQASEYGALAEDSHGFGWSGEAPHHDWATLIAAKDREIARLNAIYLTMLETAGITCFEERAVFAGPHTLRLGDRQVTAERIVIAVGGHPVWPEIEGARLGIVSDDAFHLPALPRRVTVVGGGYIGVEFACIFKGLGAEVDLLFRQRLPLRGFDHEMREHLKDALEAAGIRVHPSVLLHAVELRDDGCRRLTLTNGQHFDSDLVFFALGRVPNTAGLGLEQAGVAVTDTGAIRVDADGASSQRHVFAIGDVSNRLNLTPVALAEGHRLADRLFGGTDRRWNLPQVPTAVFSTPPLATCGLTEEAAASQGPVDIYAGNFTPGRHRMSGRDRRTFLKLVVDQASQRVLGAHMLGDDAPEMMQGIAVAMTAGATKHDFDMTVGIHPTAAEEWVTMRVRTRVAGGEAAAA